MSPWPGTMNAMMERVRGEVACRVAENPHEEVSPLSETEQFVYLTHSAYHRERGIAGILTKPYSLRFATIKERLVNESTYALPLHKLVLLLHGNRSHKNSNFQPHLAERLSQEGYYVLRIDFRGLGDSEDCGNPAVGRTLEQDVEDISTVYEFAASDACVELVGHALTLDTIVAHSRGVLSMFEFALRHPVRNLVNCCGRFEATGWLERVMRTYPNFSADKGIPCVALRHGERQEIWLPEPEVLSVATTQIDRYANIDVQTWVVSIYGTADAVIPLTAAGNFANMFRGRHTLEIVVGAGHDFYGLPDDENLMELPTKKGRVCYHSVLASKVVLHLRNKNQAEQFHSLNRTLEIPTRPGVLLPRWPLPHDFSRISNFRDLGGYMTASGRRVRHGILYRCANPCDVTPEALQYMKDVLQIAQVFDLRATAEAAEAGILSGIPVCSVPFNKNMSMSPEEVARHYQDIFISTHNIPAAYEGILENSVESIGRFFRAIVDGTVGRGRAAIFHCAVGKDRTGILAMLVLGLLGVDADTIAHEYELTTIGITTEKKIYDLLAASSSKFYDIMGPAGRTIAREYQLTQTKIRDNILASPYEAMRVFIDRFLAIHGSFSAYFESKLGLQPEDIKLIRHQLLE